MALPCALPGIRNTKAVSRWSLQLMAKSKGAGRRFAFCKQAQWQVVPGKTNQPGLLKKQGAEGPIYAAFSDRHVYVYGTRDNPSPEERQRRMDCCDSGGQLVQYRGEFLGRMLVFPAHCCR